MGTNLNWMNDEALYGIERGKLEFLDKVFLKSGSVDKGNQKEILSFLMSISRLSKDNNISFSKDEVELIFNVIRKYSDSEDIAKMEKIFSLFRFS